MIKPCKCMVRRKENEANGKSGKEGRKGKGKERDARREGVNGVPVEALYSGRRTAAAVVIHRLSYQRRKRRVREQEEGLGPTSGVGSVRAKWGTIDKTWSAAWFRLRRARNAAHHGRVDKAAPYIYIEAHDIHNRIFLFPFFRERKRPTVKTGRSENRWERRSDRDTKGDPDR